MRWHMSMGHFWSFMTKNKNSQYSVRYSHSFDWLKTAWWFKINTFIVNGHTRKILYVWTSWKNIFWWSSLDGCIMRSFDATHVPYCFGWKKIISFIWIDEFDIRPDDKITKCIAGEISIRQCIYCLCGTKLYWLSLKWYTLQDTKKKFFF